MRKLILQKISYNLKHYYCCQLMEKFTVDYRVGIDYYSVYREYYLDTTSLLKQTINYCPFCGSKLPKGLSEEYFNILEKNYKIYNIEENEKNIPREFKSDQWWKKRNL